MATSPYLQVIIDESVQTRILGSCLLVFVVLSVAVRMYVRLRMLKQFGSEDWSMIVAFLLCASQLILSIITCTASIRVIHGDGSALKLTSILPQLCTAFYALAMLSLKNSLGFFFIKIFSHRKAQRWTIIVLCVCSTITGIAYFALSAFTCVSLKTAPSTLSTCKLQPYGTGVFYAFSVVSIASDFIFATMAIAALIAAKLPTATKIPACALLMLGTVSGIASIIRFALIVQPSSSQNYVRDLFAVGKWTTVEHAIGVITANLAMTRPLLHAFVMRVRGGLSSLTNSRIRNGTSASVTLDNKTGSPASSNKHGNKLGKVDSAHGLESQLAQTDLRRTNGSGELHLLVDVKREVTVVVDEDKADHTASDAESSVGGRRPSDLERGVAVGVGQRNPTNVAGVNPPPYPYRGPNGAGSYTGRNTFEETYLPGRSRY